MQVSGVKYIERVFKSIKENAIAVHEEEGIARLQELLCGVRDFYASLFQRKNGKF